MMTRDRDKTRQVGIVASIWESYASEVLPRDCHATQVIETRRAFYAGAHGLLTEIMAQMSHGVEVTEADVRKLQDIMAELDTFMMSVVAGKN